MGAREEYEKTTRGPGKHSDTDALSLCRDTKPHRYRAIVVTPIELLSRLARPTRSRQALAAAHTLEQQDDTITSNHADAL